MMNASQNFFRLLQQLPALFPLLRHVIPPEQLQALALRRKDQYLMSQSKVLSIVHDQ